MRDPLPADAVARSRPLTAHLDPTRDVPPPPEFDVDEFLEEWRDAFGSAEAFRDRLDLADHTPDSARERLATSGDPPDDFPSAFETAGRVVDRANALDPDAVEPVAARHADRAFVDLIAPLAAVGREGLDADDSSLDAGESPGEPVDVEATFAPGAVESLVDLLFDRLATVLQHPLFILFKAHQRAEYPDADFADATDSTAVYEEFVASSRDLGTAFEQYPVLPELVGTAVEQWWRSVRRLADRLAADRQALARTFADGDDLGRVSDVEALSNDPHGDGEVVLGLRFANDCSVVYKPRSLAGERAFGDLLDWLDDRADLSDFATPAVLDRGEYGWMEYVTHRPCGSPAAVERYYERMGGLSALGFVLGSRDFHHENVVAAGEHPVVVDGETALSPLVDDPTGGSTALTSLLGDSILDTLLVPYVGRTRGGDDELVTSGLGNVGDERRQANLPAFHHPNTDAMDLTFDGDYSFEGGNLPTYDGSVREASDYVPSLKCGFRAVTDAIREAREAFLADDGPLAGFEGVAVRHVFRPTGAYATKRKESLYPSRLRSGLRRSLVFEPLYDDVLPRTGDRDQWRLVPAETAALQRSVIPRFTVPATGRGVHDGHGTPLGAFVDESPVAHARQRVAALDDYTVDAQLRLLDLALTDATVADPVSGGAGESDSDSTADPDAASADDRTLASAASSSEGVVANVAELLDETASRTDDGALRWAEPTRSSPTDDLLVHEPGPDLYEGYAGVGVFLAAAAAVRDDAELAAASRSALRSALTAFDAGHADDLGIGGMTGTGSVAYGLATAGDLLGDPDLLDRARAVAGRIDHDDVAADETLDVVGGAAGELLAQLAVHERTGDRDALDRARRCGDRLLDATTETDAGFRVPTRRDRDPRFAFAHGAGGMGYALVRLGGVTGDGEYAAVGREALRVDVDRWRRGRGDGDDREGETTTIWGWCNGPAGVGTCRVAVADASAFEGDGEDNVSFLREHLRTDPSLEDSLCCGSAGRALFMLDAGETVGDPELVERARRLLGDTLDRARREGRFRLANHVPSLPKFALFTGLAGVGYAALSFEAREAGVDLPNVARLE